MKKHLTQLLLSLLFLVVTAMTCDEQDWAEPIDVPCTLKEVELYHWDNAGEKPKEAVDNKVLKESPNGYSYTIPIYAKRNVANEG